MESSIDLQTTETNSGKINGYLWLAFFICFCCSVSAGLISTLMSVYLPIVVQNLSTDISADEFNNISAYINSLYLAGWAIGGFLWGYISDKIGRAKTLALSVGTLGLFTFLISFVSSWELVVTFRLLSGFSAGGILVITPTLLTEIWPSKSRSVVIGIDNVGFPIGIFSSGLVSSFVNDWRGAFLIGIAPLLIGILIISVLKESERWKNSRGENKESIKDDGSNKANLIKGSIIFGSMLIGLWGLFSWIPTWVQSLIINSDGQTERSLAMMLLGAGAISGGFISGLVSNGLGVRKAMLLCFAGCIVMSFLLFGTNAYFSFVIYIELLVLSLFIGISQGLLAMYIPQLFPIQVRGTYTGFCFNIGRIVTALAVFFVGVLVTTLGGYSNILLTFAGVFIAGFIVMYVTKDQDKTKR